MELTLDDDQAAVLRDVLSSALRDLRFEIAGTDNAGFRRELQAREAVLRALLDPLGGPAPSS